MPIFISNSFYLSELEASIANRPLIGWHSVFENTSVYNDETLDIIGENPINVWSSDTYTRWSAENADASAGDAGLIFAIDESINYYGIAGHNLGSIGAYYAWQHLDAIGGNWQNITDFRIPANDTPIMDLTDELFPPDSAVRLFISVPVGKTVRIAHIKIGNILRLARPIWAGITPGGMDERTEKISSKSYSGNYLGTVLISQGSGFSIEQKNNTISFIRSSELQNFFKHANLLQKLAAGPVETFFYAWRPDTHPLEVQYCCRVGEFSPPKNDMGNKIGGFMSWSMSGDAYK
jgi:hypothetical protein